jgi:hypothetical protein
MPFAQSQTEPSRQVGLPVEGDRNAGELDRFSALPLNQMRALINKLVNAPITSLAT